MRFAYLMQTFLVAGWWLTIATRDEIYQWFAFNNIEKQIFFQFLLPDVIVLCVGSIIAAMYNNRIIKGIVLGGWLYATLFCFSAGLTQGGGWLSCMAMFIGTLFNVFLVLDKQMFRPSPTQSALSNGLKTLLQSAITWLLTLVVFPIVILTAMETEIIWHQFGMVQGIAIVLFLLASTLGCVSAYYMVTVGKGTPAPLDHATTLVIRGPYAFVRNPMAIAGLTQGYTVALYFESLHVAVYVTLGAIAWQFVVRPIEEADLQKRFKSDYDHYRKQVKCWWPRLRRYAL